MLLHDFTEKTPLWRELSLIFYRKGAEYRTLRLFWLYKDHSFSIEKSVALRRIFGKLDGIAVGEKSLGICALDICPELKEWHRAAARTVIGGDVFQRNAVNIRACKRIHGRCFGIDEFAAVSSCTPSPKAYIRSFEYPTFLF